MLNDPSHRARPDLSSASLFCRTIELCVRWYITYRLSYRDLVAMMAERGIVVSNGLRYRPDGSLFASAHGVRDEDEIVRIWDSATGNVATNISEPKSAAGALSHAGLELSPHGRL